MAPKKNAFIIFCEEYRQQNSQSGKNMSLKEAIEVAGPLWSQMNDTAREKYRAKARQGSQRKKCTTLGIPIDYIQKIEEEKKAYEQKMFETIARTVQAMVAMHSLHYLDICIFHVNTFCYSPTHKRHYPAEIAIAKFNLRDGVWDVYHAVCNPGRLPLGYAAVVQTKSNETHQLLPSTASNNLEKIFYDIISFIDDRSGKNKPPPLYVSPNNYDVAKEVLSTMCTDCCYNPSFLEVYSLSYLFYEIRNAAAGSVVFPSVSIPIMEFERDIYEYTSGIACDIHEELGVQNHCSKSIVTRMAYIICDHCCRDLNIELNPGKHVPFNAKVARSQASSEISFNNNDEKYRRRKANGSSSDLSVKSEKLRYSSVSDDDTSSTVSDLALKIQSSSLNFDETEADVSSLVSSLEFNTCSSEDSDEKLFEPMKHSQESSSFALNSLTQKTVSDYSSDDSSETFYSDISRKNKREGKGSRFVHRK